MQTASVNSVTNIDFVTNLQSILASVDIEAGSGHYITKETEKFINDNGDAFPRAEVLRRFGTFKTNARTYVEHNQGPENAKEKNRQLCRNG